MQDTIETEADKQYLKWLDVRMKLDTVFEIAIETVYGSTLVVLVFSIGLLFHRALELHG